MGVRRVVTGHDDAQRSVVISDEEVPSIAFGERGGWAWPIWGRDDTAHFPDGGTAPTWTSAFPPIGGCRLTVFSLTPGGSEDFDNFITQNLAEYAVPDRPGLHRTPTLDFDIVLAGEVVLELEDDHEVTLSVGDIVVQNGTRHRWVNRGSTEARIAAVTIGADHKLSA